MMKKRIKFKKVVAILLCVLSCVCCFACNKRKNEVELNRDFKNVILVIGDGMGENHILNAIDYFDLDLPIFLADQKGYIDTNSLDGLTDSAAGGTALATGVSVYNGNIAQLDGVDLKQITTYAQEANMKTGVITTDSLGGATPSAFSAHAYARSSIVEIINTQVDSGINILIGEEDSNYSNRATWFPAQGYAFARSKEQLVDKKSSEKLMGSIRNVGSQYIPGKEDSYQLKDMAKFAIEYLENDYGFFLMIEGAYIDKYSHNNEYHNAMSEVRSLIDTIEFLYEYASDGETAIFITADHETGGLIRESDKTKMSNELYTTGGHTDVNVPLFVKNYAFDITNFGYLIGEVPKNTIVFEACKSIIYKTNA